MDDEGEAHQSIHVFTINMFFFCTGYSPTADTERAYLCLKHVRVGIKGDFFYQNSHCDISIDAPKSPSHTPTHTRVSLIWRSTMVLGNETENIWI